MKIAIINNLGKKIIINLAFWVFTSDSGSSSKHFNGEELIEILTKKSDEIHHIEVVRGTLGNTSCLFWPFCSMLRKPTSRVFIEYIPSVRNFCHWPVPAINRNFLISTIVNPVPRPENGLDWCANIFSFFF